MLGSISADLVLENSRSSVVLQLMPGTIRLVMLVKTYQDTEVPAGSISFVKIASEQSIDHEVEVTPPPYLACRA